MSSLPSDHVLSVSTIQELPSAQRHKLHVQGNPVDKFVEWAHSGDAKNDDIDLIYITDLNWMKEPGYPSHEFLLVSIMGPQLKQPTALRIERDTESWATVFRPYSRSVCKDTVTLAESYGWGSLLKTQPRQSQSLASVTFQSNNIPLLKLVILLDVISQSPGFYNVWTVNCWWFAETIWRNIVELAKENEMKFLLVEEEELARFWGSVTDGADVKNWDARKFGLVQEQLHAVCLMRAFGDNVAKSKVDHWSKEVDDIFTLRAYNATPRNGATLSTPQSKTQRSAVSSPRTSTTTMPSTPAKEQLTTAPQLQGGSATRLSPTSTLTRASIDSGPS
ncbi:hypothetical protein JAAARDRAFT_61578 [Jaapia argillacea MUCL 33604]|uniref:Uncharacterized protein n=1 Tax=Jaapia argillacea MUCL 33604 TaxID=933084 RepID=A0A067PRQ6_9AGAM|nr:hypothetical protein JAAARDRAFT_61578 [Jaapia argillacea MUCL 33604]